jgi:hypothetical protein
MILVSITLLHTVEAQLRVMCHLEADAGVPAAYSNNVDHAPPNPGHFDIQELRSVRQSRWCLHKCIEKSGQDLIWGKAVTSCAIYSKVRKVARLSFAWSSMRLKKATDPKHHVTVRASRLGT